MEDNIFIKIIKGEIPSFTIYEDDDFKVILDRFPSSLGHTLIIPKKACENIHGLDDDTARKLFPLIKKMAGVLQKTLCCDGMNILQNNGEAAGQSVFYFHVHLIPRYENDKVTIHHEQTNYPVTEFQEMVKRIKSNGIDIR